eukprot:7384594-Prymnesium_polylepis.1
MLTTRSDGGQAAARYQHTSYITRRVSVAQLLGRFHAASSCEPGHMSITRSGGARPPRGTDTSDTDVG